MKIIQLIVSVATFVAFTMLIVQASSQGKPAQPLSKEGSLSDNTTCSQCGEFNECCGNFSNCCGANATDGALCCGNDEECCATGPESLGPICCTDDELCCFGVCCVGEEFCCGHEGVEFGGVCCLNDSICCPRTPGSIHPWRCCPGTSECCDTGLLGCCENGIPIEKIKPEYLKEGLPQHQ